MSELTTLARPYAEAAYARAKETGSGQQWEDMLGFLSVVLQDPLMQRASSNPNTQRAQFCEAVLDLCGDQLNGDGKNFVRVLVQNGRLALVPQIAALYAEYRAEDEGYIDVRVETAYPLDAAEEERIGAIVEGLLRRKPRLSTQVEPSLIGGVLIRAGDRVIDASLRGQLQRLEKRLCN